MSRHIVVDGKAHSLGRLASVVAQELLHGAKITIVRCEEVEITGVEARNRQKYMHFLNKRTNYNPLKGPFHHRAPSAMVYRVIRGMIPHKTARGQAALGRLEVFEGVPPVYQNTKRMSFAPALRVNNVKSNRPTTKLGALAATVGWKHAEVIESLENKRKERAAANYVESRGQCKKCACPKLAEVNQELAALGY